MFSERTQFTPAETVLEDAIAAARAQGQTLFDLTISTPSAVGLLPDTEKTLAPLQNPDAMQYRPDPRGLPEAREAIAAYYSHQVSADRILLTAGTSEAYSYLFRLLCNVGDEVLVPQPGYPLFDMLAAFDGVHLRSYPLLYDHGWQVDLAALEAAITSRTRAILLVHPNNPTGHLTSPHDREALYRLAGKHNLAMIVDEVFLDYPIEAAAKPVSFVANDVPALTFVLSGASKVCALPQMKAAWTCVCGPQQQVREAIYRLELLADTFLSVSTPIQLALPSWLAARGEVQRRISERVLANLQTLDAALEGTEASRLHMEAGWAVVLRLPAIETDSALTLRLLQQHGVVVHPGSFYGFPPTGRIVLSLLTPQDVFQKGITQLLRGIKPVNYPSSGA